MSALVSFNLVLVASLTGFAVFKRSAKLRSFCIVFFLMAQLYLPVRYMIAYRSVPNRSEDVLIEKTENIRQAWLMGVFDMHRYSLVVYIPLFIIYGVGMAVVALTPSRNNIKEQESQQDAQR